MAAKTSKVGFEAVELLIERTIKQRKAALANIDGDSRSHESSDMDFVLNVEIVAGTCSRFGLHGPRIG